MDNKTYLTDQIKKAKRKMNLAKMLTYGMLFAAIGGIGGMLCEFTSLVWQFYYVNLAAVLCFGAGLLAGIGYAVYRRADMKQAAGRLDSFGLQERMLTAYENMAKEDELARLQREDALLCYNKIRDQIKLPILPDKRYILALLVSVLTVMGMSLIPSPVREEASLSHQVREQAREEEEQLLELLEALEEVDPKSLTKEQGAQLAQLMETMNLSREELAGTDSWEGLERAAEKLDYKYEQAAQSLDDLAAGMDNPQAAGVASAQALAKAAANKNGQPPLSAGAAVSAAAPDDGSGDGQNGGGQGSGGSSDGQGKGDGFGADNGDGAGQGQKGGSGKGQGSGSGKGNGQGNGSGQGQGSGSVNGSGVGGGRGTGSSSTAHDYVSVPNAVAEDPSLKGIKSGAQDSDYYRQQNGLAWEGAHVEYSSVIGAYTDSAYEGLANGTYPSGMETVIRDYFENLNK